MAINLVSVGSSSSGNSYIIKAGERLIVMDAGLSCIKITRALESLGYEAQDVNDIFITHEHSDHVKSVRTLARKCAGAKVYASRGTVMKCSEFEQIDDDRIVPVKAGDEVRAGELVVKTFALSHDAREPIGFSVSGDGEKLSVVTDTGIVTEEIYDEVRDASMLVLEANHDEDLLMYGEYPYKLKLRIKSDEGHLSNRAAGEMLARLLADRAAEGCAAKDGDAEPFPVMLAHLSFHNNAPFRARQTVEEILSENGFERDRDYTLTVAAKEGLTVLEK